jgi:DNA/RNA endonuclease G (NUC1)
MPTPSTLRRALSTGALAVFALAGCDALPFGSSPKQPEAPTRESALSISCQADVRRGTMSCAVPVSSEDGPNAAIIGGQGTYVRLTSSNIEVITTADPAVADTMKADVTVQNLLNEALGTSDGVNAHPDGIRVFFHTGPTVTASTDGQPATISADGDGTGVFTSTGQQYFEYGPALTGDGMLTGVINGGPGETSLPNRWRFALSDNVQTFAFTVFVDAAVQPLVAITEVMANPSLVQDSLGEYVELRNRGTLPVDLQGWTIQDGTGSPLAPNPVAVAFTGNLTVAGGTSVLGGRSSNASLNGGIEPDFVYALPGQGGVMALSNSSGDFVRIRNADGFTIDSVKYDSALVAIGARAGYSRERLSFAAGSANVTDTTGVFWRYASGIYNGVDRGTPTPRSGVTPGGNGGVSLNANAPLYMPVGYDKPIFVNAVYDSNGNDITASSQITWTSSDTTVAVVDQLGYVTGRAVGSVTITATASTGPTGSVSLSVVTATAPHTADYNDHVEFGAPTDATPGDEFAIIRDQFRASYNPGRRSPNWVAWNLNASQFEQGTNNVQRCNCFTDEPFVADSARSYDIDYRGGGYDRGHMVQSESRTNTFQENATTFLLSNILPQAADNNQGPWLVLENYMNTLARDSARELFIIAGGQYGATPPTLKDSGRVAIPEYTWKVALILPAGQGLANVDDAGDVRVIAVRMPNFTIAHASAGDPRLADRNAAWTSYVTTVNSIEASTGYDLFGLLGDAIEDEVEARAGTGNNQIATSLDITTQPADSAVTGSFFTRQPVVQVRDQNGDPMGGVRAVTAALASGTGTLVGTKTVNSSAAGVATFTNLSIDGDGPHTIAFTAGGLVGDTSTTVLVVPASDAAPTVSTTNPTNGATGVSTSASIVINFTEDVTVNDSAFTVACPAGTPITFTVTGSGATRTLTPAAALPASTTCSVHVDGTYVFDVDGSPDVMGSSYDFSFTTGAGAQAVLRLNEINPSITSARDLVELLVVTGGNVNGMRLMQDSVTTLAILPNVNVSTGDIIVVHLTPTAASGDATTPETLSKSENGATTNYATAWDFQGNGTAAIGASFRTIRIQTSGGEMQDAVSAVTGSGTAPGTWPRSLQQIQEAGQWLPVNCGGAPCTTTSSPTANQVSASWAGAGTSATGNSLRRVAGPDTNLAADWSMGTQSFGLVNP